MSQQETSVMQVASRAVFVVYFTLISCLAYSATLKTVATCPPEMSVDTRPFQERELFITTTVRTSNPIEPYSVEPIGRK
jgi:hypothetical protein